MNIRDRKPLFPLVLLLLGSMSLLSSCHRDDDPVKNPLQTGIPIRLSATSDWPQLTRADVIDEDNYNEQTFAVWGLYQEAPDPLVFDGTSVWWDVEIGDSGAWTYESDEEPVRYWSVGNYSFAAVMPSGALPVSEVSWEPTTLTFDPSFDLSQNQRDIMIALAEEEYTTDDMSSDQTKSVTLSFGHQLSLLNFTVSNDIDENSTISIKSLRVYGLHSSASMWSSEDGWYLDELLSDPFVSVPVTSDLEYGDQPLTLIENLLAFPETDAQMIVEVTYTESWDGAENPTAEITKATAPISVSWEPAKVYTYPLTINKSEIIFINEPTVTEWQDGGNAGGITIKSN